VVTAALPTIMDMGATLLIGYLAAMLRAVVPFTRARNHRRSAPHTGLCADRGARGGVFGLMAGAPESSVLRGQGAALPRGVHMRAAGFLGRQFRQVLGADAPLTGVVDRRHLARLAIAGHQRTPIGFGVRPAAVLIGRPPAGAPTLEQLPAARSMLFAQPIGHVCGSFTARSNTSDRVQLA